MINFINVLIPDKQNVLLNDTLGDSGLLLLVDKNDMPLGFIEWGKDCGYYLQTRTNSSRQAVYTSFRPEEDTIQDFLERYKSQYKIEVKVKYLEIKK